MKKIVLLVLLFVGGFGWYYMQNLSNNTEDKITFYGNVENRTQKLAFRFLGTIESISKDEGQSFEKAEPLVTLDTKPLEYSLEKLKAQIAAESALLEKLQNGYRHEDIAQAKAAFEESEATLDGIQDTYERQKKLYETKATTEQSYISAKTQYERAKAAKAKAKSHYNLLKQGYQKEDIQAQKEKVAALKAEEKNLLYNIKDSTLLAPQKGTVLARYKEPGSIAAPGESVLEIALQNEYWVRAYVDEPLLGKIKRGEEMLIYTDSRKEPYKGSIGFISDVAEFTPKNIETTVLRPDLVYRFRVIITNPDSGLKQGMPVTIKALEDS